MSGLPTPHLLHVRRRQVGEKDQHGNPKITFSEPEPWPVAGIAPGAMREGEADRDLSEIVWTVYAPTTQQVPGELDRVLIGPEEYQVEGRARDWSQGPWPHPTAGVVVELRRIEG